MKEWTPQEIKELRTSHSITQKAFADLLGVTRVYVGLLERNEKKPSKMLKLLLNYVGERLNTGRKKGKEVGMAKQKEAKGIPKGIYKQGAANIYDPS